MNYSLNQRLKTFGLHEKQQSGHSVPCDAVQDVFKGLLPSSQPPVRVVAAKKSIMSASHHAQSNLRSKDRIVEAKDDLVSENIIPERGLPRLNGRLSSSPGISRPYLIPSNASEVQSVEESSLALLTGSAPRRPLPSVHVSEGQRLGITQPRLLGPPIKVSASESSSYFDVKSRAPYRNPIHRSSPLSRPWSSEAVDISAANHQSVTILDDDSVDSNNLWEFPSGEFSVDRRYHETSNTKDSSVPRQGVSILDPKLYAAAHGEYLSSVAESCDNNTQSFPNVSNKDVELSKTGIFQTIAPKAPSAAEKSALDNLLHAKFSNTMHTRTNQPLHGPVATVASSREVVNTVRGQASYLTQNMGMPRGPSEFGHPKYGMLVRKAQGVSVLPLPSNEGIAMGLPLQKVSLAQREKATDIAASVSSARIVIGEKHSDLAGASSTTDSAGVTSTVSALAADTIFEASAGFDSERYSCKQGPSNYNLVPSNAISSSSKARPAYVVTLPVTNLTEQDPAKALAGVSSDGRATVPIVSGVASQSVSVDAEHVMFKAFVTQACNSFSQPLSDLMSKVFGFEEICKNMKDEISAVQQRVRDFEMDFEKYFRCVSNGWMQPRADVPERDRLDCAPLKPSTGPANTVAEPSTGPSKEAETTSLGVGMPSRCDSRGELSHSKQPNDAGKENYEDDDVLFVDDGNKNSRCGRRSSDTETVCYGIGSGSSSGASSPVSTCSLDAPRAEEKALLILNLQTTDVVNSSGLQSVVNSDEVLKPTSDVRAGSAPVSEQSDAHKQVPSKVIYVRDDDVEEASSGRLRPESRKRNYPPSLADRCEMVVELAPSRDAAPRRAYRGKSATRSSLERVAVDERLQGKTIDLVDEDEGAKKRKYSS